MNMSFMCWVIDVITSHMCDAFTALHLSTVCVELHTFFSKDSESFWKRCLYTEETLSMVNEEMCKVQAPNKVKWIQRACVHNWWGTMIAFVGNGAKHKGGDIFMCGINGCGLRFASMCALHKHQSDYCLLRRGTNQNESIIERYSRCCETDRQTRKPCRSRVHIMMPQLGQRVVHRTMEWVRREQCKHYAECHMEYRCTHTWCTATLLSCVQRLWLFVTDEPIVNKVHIRTYTHQLLQRCKALLVTSTNEHTLTVFVKTVTSELVLLASLFKSSTSHIEWMTPGFVTRSALCAHEREEHTVVCNFPSVNASCTLSSLATQAIDCYPQADHIRPFRYLLEERLLSPHIRHSHDHLVAALVSRLELITQPRVGIQRCNMQGVFAALVVPANRYDGEIAWYVKQLVLMHSSVYVQEHITYSDTICEVITDIYRLLDACSSIQRHRYLLVSAEDADPVVTASEWWSVATNKQLGQQVFRLCVHVHTEFAKCLDGSVFVNVWPKNVTVQLVTELRDALCIMGDRTRIDDMTRCLSYLRNQVALVNKQTIANRNDHWESLLMHIDSVLTDITDKGGVVPQMLCVLLRTLDANMSQNTHYRQLCTAYNAFKYMVCSFRTTWTSTQINRTVSFLIRLPEVVRVQHVYKPYITKNQPVCTSVSICAKAMCTDIGFRFIQVGGIMPVKIKVASTHITSLQKLISCLQQFVADSA